MLAYLLLSFSGRLHIDEIKQMIEAIPNGQSKMDNPEKPVIWSTQDEDKQKKITTQYVLDNTICKQTHIVQIRHELSYKQLEVKTNRTSFKSYGPASLCLSSTYITLLRRVVVVCNIEKKNLHFENFKYFALCLMSI